MDPGNQSDKEGWKNQKRLGMQPVLLLMEKLFYKLLIP
jgi:hypothetical protein